MKRRAPTPGERVRGYLRALGIQQKALAAEMHTDPASVTRFLNNPDAFRFFEIGCAAARIQRKQHHL